LDIGVAVRGVLSVVNVQQHSEIEMAPISCVLGSEETSTNSLATSRSCPDALISRITEPYAGDQIA